MGDIHGLGKDADGCDAEGVGVHGGDRHDSGLFDWIFSVGLNDWHPGSGCARLGHGGSRGERSSSILVRIRGFLLFLFDASNRVDAEMD